LNKITYQNSLDFAKSLDEKDVLRSFRKQFHFPKKKDGSTKLYFCGNSLGLQPKNVKTYVNEVIEDWQNYGVDGHTEATYPWLPYHEFLSKSMSKIVGAKESEVIIMNTLSVNLHLMLVSFYKPSAKKRKILIEADAFPSDLYGVQSQLKFHGLDPVEDLILWKPRENQYYNLSDFDALLEKHHDELALVMIGNTNYYTGQYFDMKHITERCHEHNISVGFDLAHGVGNIQPDLHALGVDFAVWCTYKYLNSGPGSLGGCFVHEKHHKNKDIPRFEGWWGHDKSTRFNMRQAFSPIESAEAWQLSNPPILSMAAVRASLNVFEEAGFDNILDKSKAMTGYLEYLLKELKDENINIITPENPKERGCQLSIQFLDSDKSLFNQLTKAGVVADWREPKVIRIAPAPLYNSYQDVFKFVTLLKEIRDAG
jgi:kynureninase